MSCDGCMKADCGSCTNCLDKKGLVDPVRKKSLRTTSMHSWYSGMKKPNRIRTDSKVTVDLVTDEASVLLLKHGRKTIPITGDGNCLFRCFSLILFGDQDQHLRAQTSLVDFIKKKPSFFTTYCLPLTVPGHSQRMANNFAWGTHACRDFCCFIMYFNLPIICCNCQS